MKQIDEDVHCMKNQYKLFLSKASRFNLVGKHLHFQVCNT